MARRHKCPRPDCNEWVPVSTVTCTRCWRLLPLEIRRQISASLGHDVAMVHARSAAGRWFAARASGNRTEGRR